MITAIEAARAAFIKAAKFNEVEELGVFIRDEGDGECSIEGTFNLDKALQAAIEAAERVRHDN
jgi:hypothetical protein